MSGYSPFSHSQTIDSSPEQLNHGRNVDRSRDYDHEDSYRRRYRSRSISYSRSRSRSRDRSRSRSPRYDGRHRRYRRSRDRDRSRSRDCRSKRSHSRDRYIDDKRRRRWSGDDDGCSSRGSYDSNHDHDFTSTRDNWLAHVWNNDSTVRSTSVSDYDSNSDVFDRSSYKNQLPNKTLIFRGLGAQTTERDIKEAIISAGAHPRDIRLIRKRDTGWSRGFAFVEFHSTDEAKSLVERFDGEFSIKSHRVVMQYSIQKETEKANVTDWNCKCGALNFKRRDFCYKCNSERKYGQSVTLDESSSYPTQTVMLKGLDSVTTEENVLKIIQNMSSLPIRCVRIGRDKITNSSRGVCYLEMNNVSEAIQLHNALLLEKPRINGRYVYISYGKSISVVSDTSVVTSSKKGIGNAAVAAAQWSHQKNETSADEVRYALCDVPKLAEYSAALYAKTVTEKEAHLKYYTDYYTKVINDGGTLPYIEGIHPGSNSNVLTSLPTVNFITAGGQQFSKRNHAQKGDVPTGDGTKIYPIPNMSSYQFDKTSGFFYDPFTTLYYDPKSHYYFNSNIKKYLYWDGEKNTYFVVSSADDAEEQKQHMTAAEMENEKKSKETDFSTNDKDKVKVAKRIAKDMEKWAKTLNHKKVNAKNNIVMQTTTSNLSKLQGHGAAAADIGYTVGVLGKKEDNPFLSALPSYQQYSQDLSSKNSLVAAYGNQGGSDDSDSDGGGNQSTDVSNEELRQDDKHVNWNKMACLLCKRAFSNKETLLKHQQLSDLHKKNLEDWYKSCGISQEDAQEKSVQYRDRAKERRVKYNEPDRPPSNHLKENYMKSKREAIYEQPSVTPNNMRIGDDNVGNKLLQKMGWQEGMGLGKKNQGRTDIIQAEARPSTAGLGSRSAGVTPGPGETYKDCVKKMMRMRYQELDDR